MKCFVVIVALILYSLRPIGFLISALLYIKTGSSPIKNHFKGWALIANILEHTVILAALILALKYTC